MISSTQTAAGAAMSDPPLRVQVQLHGQGERCDDVAAWLAVQVPHLDARVAACPGLMIDLEIPRAGVDGFESWPARLMAAVSPLDVALEIIAAALDELGVEATELLSVHLTAS